MKKRLILAIALLVVTFATGILTACDDKNVTQAYIKQDTVVTEIQVGQTLDTSNAVLVLEYKNGKTKEITSELLTFSHIDTLEAGTKVLKITYKTVVATLEIEVKESENTVAVAMSLDSKLLNAYNANKQSQGANSKTEFYNRQEPLYAGTDNPFNFNIVATGTNQDGNMAMDINRVRSDIEIELKNQDNTFTLLENQELEQYVESVDTTYAIIKFAPAAAGQQFKVTVKAKETDPGYSQDSTHFTAELTVIEGYNVYNAKQLSIFNNRNGIVNWEPFKQQFGLDGVTANTMILQNDINITKNDIPEGFFWKQGDANFPASQAKTDQPLEGSLKDFRSQGIYTRQMQHGEQFTMIGNYFTINVSNLPKVLVDDVAESAVHVEGNDFVTTHATLFYTGSAAPSEITEGTNMFWKNIRFIGNAVLNEDVRNSGGIIQSKHDAVNFTAYNTITTSFYVSYFVERGVKANPHSGFFVLNNIKAYDSFSTPIYVWGAKSLIIKDSEIINGGGPVILADHAGMTNSNPETGDPSHIDIINSKLESIVNGQEPWFVNYGATTIVQQLAALDGFFNHEDFKNINVNNKTMIAKNQEGLTFMNLIAAMKSGSSESLTYDRIHGYIRVFQTEQDFNKHYGLNGEEQQQTTFGLEMTGTLADKAFTNVTYIEANGNGGYINSSFATATPNGDTSILAGKPFDDGTHLNIYTDLGIGAVVQLYPRTA